ncbi:phage head-tail connector protein [Terribacillus sp. 179-K 1B1 HS]|uniref:phage head-tail connector protein n=1 Tax=Terribacillus sp. 179-K 1B1 HS TaxID=3142388 RepID=UPI00399FAC30
MAMTTEEVKKILQIKTTKHDEFFGIMIPLVEDFAKHKCNNLFLDPITGEENLPGGVQIFVAKACQHNMQPTNVKSRTMGNVSYSYELEFPTSITKLLAPYKRLKFV